MLGEGALVNNTTATTTLTLIPQGLFVVWQWGSRMDITYPLLPTPASPASFPIFCSFNETLVCFLSERHIYLFTMFTRV